VSTLANIAYTTHAPQSTTAARMLRRRDFDLTMLATPSSGIADRRSRYERRPREGLAWSSQYAKRRMFAVKGAPAR